MGDRYTVERATRFPRRRSLLQTLVAHRFNRVALEFAVIVVPSLAGRPLDLPGVIDAEPHVHCGTQWIVHRIGDSPRPYRGTACVLGAR
jgi:hypothetical protein